MDASPPSSLKTAFESQHAIFADTDTGAYVSHDRGEHWIKITEFADASLTRFTVAGIYVSALTKTPDGRSRVYRSLNEGNTWELINPPNSELIKDAGVTGNELVVRTSSSVFACPMMDGPHCKQIKHILPETRFKKLAGYNGRLLLFGKGAFVSSDDASTWTSAPIAPGSYRFHVADGTALLDSADSAYYSQDAITWVRIAIEPGRRLLALTSAHKKFLRNNLSSVKCELGGRSTIDIDTRPIFDRRLMCREWSDERWKELSNSRNRITESPIQALFVDGDETVYLVTLSSVEKLDPDGWTNIASGPLSGVRISSSFLDKNDVVIVGASTGLLWTNDRGKTWNRAHGGRTRRNLRIVLRAGLASIGPNILLFRSAGGVFLSVDSVAAPPREEYFFLLKRPLGVASRQSR